MAFQVNFTLPRGCLWRCGYMSSGGMRFGQAGSTMDTDECCFGCALAVLMLPRIVGGMEVIGYMYMSADVCPK